MIVVDSSAIVAALDAADRNHQAVRDWLEREEDDLVTTPLIIAEVDYVVGPVSSVVTVTDCDAVRSELYERLSALGYEKSVVVAFTNDRRWAE